MPEGPEVKLNSVALSKAISNSVLADFIVESGRYTRNPLVGLENFRKTLPAKVIGTGCHGKFMYVIFDNGWNLWSSKRSGHTRVKFQAGDTVVYYNDIRNFGTLKFIYGAHELKKKLKKLGLDLLSSKVSPREFLSKLRIHDGKNICKVMMNQNVLAGVGNYIKSEALWIAKMNPNKLVSDFEDYELLELKEAIAHVMRSSYENDGATFLTHTGFSGRKGRYKERFACYNRKIDVDGNQVTKTKTPDGRTTYWSAERQGE